MTASEMNHQPLHSEVIVFRVDLNQPSTTLERLREVLSQAERTRADRLRFERGSARFVAARGALRIALGNALGIAPEAVRLRSRPNGKPELSEHASELRFNLTHSADLALIAVALDREVGVDVECPRPLDFEALAERFFAARERDELKRLPPDQRTLGFFQCWTRKEAYLKATGEGLSFPLDRFVVSLIPGEPARLVEVIDRPGEPERWSLRSLDLGDEYVGALVAEGSNFAVRHETFEF